MSGHLTQSFKSKHRWRRVAASLNLHRNIWCSTTLRYLMPTGSGHSKTLSLVLVWATIAHAWADQ